jgi:hypothetical protein
MVPTAGAEGVPGWALITTLAEAVEVHPTELVTVKLKVPETSPEIVVLVVEPVTLPGLIVQLPEGKPLKTTDPVARAQVGWVIVPTVGAEGVDGWALITAFAEAGEVHPRALVTANVYVPDGMDATVVLVPVPEELTAPGVRVIVHVPVAGIPLRRTLPVATPQVGCVIVPTTGAAGLALTVKV